MCNIIYRRFLKKSCNELTSKAVQFIELWSLLNVTKFMVYWQSATSEVLQILDIYEHENLVLKVGWPTLPTIGKIEVGI